LWRTNGVLVTDNHEQGEVQIMSTNDFNLQLDQDLLDRASTVFEQYGLTASQAIKLFLTQVAETNKIPLSFDYATHVPNAFTAQAIEKGRKDYQTGKLTAISASTGN